MDDDEPDEGRRTLLRLACGLPVAGGIAELALKLLEAGNVERRVARYGVRAVSAAHQPEIPVEKAAQAVSGEQGQQR